MPISFNPGRFPRIYNTLSIDIVAGALATGALAVRITNTSPGWAWWMVLALAVWFVYTADHLLDAFRGNPNLLSPRHRFHYKRRKLFIVILIIIAVIALVLAITSLDTRIIFFGFVLGAIVLVYQLVLVIPGKARSLVQKEFVIAIIYVAGIWGGPLILQERDISTGQWLVLLSLLFLAASDLLILSFYDQEQDRRAGFKSFTGQFGGRTTLIWIFALLLSASLPSLCIIFFFDDPVYIAAGAIFLIMAVLLGIMTLFTSYFSKHDRIRYLNEPVFALPALMVLV